MRTSTEISNKLKTCLKHRYIVEIANDFFSDLKDATKVSVNFYDVQAASKSIIYKWKLACKEAKHKDIDESFPCSLIAFQASTNKISAENIKYIYGIDVTTIKHCNLANTLKPLFDI